VGPVMWSISDPIEVKESEASDLTPDVTLSKMPLAPMAITMAAAATRTTTLERRRRDWRGFSIGGDYRTSAPIEAQESACGHRFASASRAHWVPGTLRGSPEP
jgi:hypothetical protein